MLLLLLSLYALKPEIVEYTPSLSLSLSLICTVYVTGRAGFPYQYFQFLWSDFSVEWVFVQCEVRETEFLVKLLENNNNNNNDDNKQWLQVHM